MKRDTTPYAAAISDGRAADAPACVILIYGEELGRRVALPGPDVTIGRDDDNGIAIALDTISRRHARIFVKKRSYYVEDLDSTNGTFVNERQIAGATALRNGDLLTCGGAVLKFIEGGNIEALYHEEIYRLTITDGLTQASNKRHLLEFLEREIARATRHTRPLSLVLFDVDRFKSINDEHGHLAGDRVLKGIAAVVAGDVRREELLARYGGEEFAIVLPETPLEAARVFAERVRRKVEESGFEYDGRPLSATISMGGAALREGDTVETLIARADVQLYKAKQDGRNRVAAD